MVKTMCWSASGKGEYLYRVKGILKKKGLSLILQQLTITCGEHLIGPSIVPQQDNDLKHISKLCKNYLGKKQLAGVLPILQPSYCGSSLTVLNVRSVHQANLTCGRCFRKYEVKSLQIISTHKNVQDLQGCN